MFVVLAALAVLDLSRSVYTASLWFYALTAVATGVVALNIHINGEDRPGSLLLQLVALAALLKFHFLYLNPFGITSDAYLYYTGFGDLSATGHIPVSMGHYYFFPGFASYAYTAVSVVAVPTELFSAFGFVSQISMIPIVYLIGRHVASHKTGLYAALFAFLTIFMFLYAHATPTHYGVTFIFLTVYAGIRIGSPGGRSWLPIFWVGALGAMTSHPVNALLLALLLVVRVARVRLVDGRQKTRTPAVPPALSYCVAYVAYLAFVAYTAFDLFARSFFVVDYAPPLATTPVAVLGRTPWYIIQSAVAPLALAVPFFFAGYATFARSKISQSEHAYLVTVGAAFLVIPGLEFLGENFKLQTSRMLIYLTIPIVFLAAHGLLSMLRGGSNARRAATAVVASFLLLGFLAPSSYLAQTDPKELYTDVPFAPSHVTDSALASRSFMDLIPEDSTIFLELGSWRYFANTNRARDPLVGLTTPDLAQFQELGGSGYVAINVHYLPYGYPSGGTFYDIPKIAARLQEGNAPLLYDSGTVRIYYAP